MAIKAATFDAGGTVLDWHSGIRGAMAEAGRAHGVDRNWGALTNQYRRLAMKGIVGHAQAEGLQKEILDTAPKQVGSIPTMYSNMANAPAVLSTYLSGYGKFRGESSFTPAEQEVVFLA